MIVGEPGAAFWYAGNSNGEIAGPTIYFSSYPVEPVARADMAVDAA